VAAVEQLIWQFTDVDRLATPAADRMHQIISDPVTEHFAEQQRDHDQVAALQTEVLTSLRALTVATRCGK
jgi:hypothetical protein